MSMPQAQTQNRGVMAVSGFTLPSKPKANFTFEDYQAEQNMMDPKILSEIIGLPGNGYCVDCGARNPDWASIGFGTLVCLDCAGRHRGWGVHVTLVRSLNLDTWTSLQLNYLLCGGNDLFVEYIDSCLKSDPQPSIQYAIPEILYYK